MLSLYRAGLRIRRAAPWGAGAELHWLPSGDDVLAFARGERFACIVNFGPQPVELPAGADVLVASDELQGAALPQDTTVWVLQAENQAPFDAGSSRTEHSNGSGQRKEGR
jgi:alpha-glucosidase